jgi:hypothetical protein
VVDDTTDVVDAVLDVEEVMMLSEVVLDPAMDVVLWVEVLPEMGPMLENAEELDDDADC